MYAIRSYYALGVAIEGMLVPVFIETAKCSNSSAVIMPFVNALLVSLIYTVATNTLSDNIDNAPDAM